jgi:hypothetical protein
MCFKSWWLWVGLLGLCITGAILRDCDDAQAQEPPAPVEVKATVVAPTQGKGAPEPAAAPGKPVVMEKGRGPGRHVAPHVKAPVEVWTNDENLRQAKGLAVNKEDAVEAAVRDACDRISRKLAKEYGEDYTPKPEYLKSQKIVKVDEATFNARILEFSGDVVDATVPVKLTDDDVTYFREQARGIRVKSRMGTTVIALAGLVALLLIGGGYLRLEEATKGYYTALLRIGALGVLACVGGALVIIWTKFWI